MKKLQVFNFEQQKIRIIEISGEPWWVAKDICVILRIKNVSDALKDLDKEEKNTIVLTSSNKGNPNMNIINESGLYSLIIRSRKPETKKFKKWITGEVLPSIRKTGIYSIKPLSTLDILEATIKNMREQHIELQEVKQEVREIKAKQITIDKNYYTISGFCSLKGIQADRIEALCMGKKASKLSRETGILIGKEYDSKYGQVNTYHVDILKSIFKEYE